MSAWQRPDRSIEAAYETGHERVVQSGASRQVPKKARDNRNGNSEGNAVNWASGNSRNGSQPAWSVRKGKSSKHRQLLKSVGSFFSWKETKENPREARQQEQERCSYSRPTAAAIIQRAWLRTLYTDHVDKDNLVKRLDLESAVLKGVLHFALYSATFILLGLALFAVEVPSAAKMEMVTVLTSELGLRDLAAVDTLDAFRAALPALSRRVKRFSVSSSARFSEPDGVVLVREREELLKARELFSPAAEPDVTAPFTLAAWVERLPGSGWSVSLLRRALLADVSLDCWGWYFPGELRYGAHDFFPLNGSDDSASHQTVVRGVGPSGAVGEVVHSVVTVSGGVATFFHNGRPLGPPTKLPRSMTGCLEPGALLLGDARIALSALKFYPRALRPNEVLEMFEGGAPLVEVATGSTLLQLHHDPLLQVGAEISAGNARVRGDVQAAQEQEMANSVAAAAAAQEQAGGGQALPDPIWPQDPSPTAALPKGEAVEMQLPEWEREAWRGAGRPRATNHTPHWLPAQDGLPSCWSALEAPVHADGSGAGRVPVLGPETTGVTVSMWFKPHTAVKGHGPNIMVVKEERGEAPAVSVSMRVQLDWVTLDFKVGSDRMFTWRFLTSFEPSSGNINERHLLTAFARGPEPVVWRHVAFSVFDAEEGTEAEMWLDGELVVRSSDTEADGVPAKFTFHRFTSMHPVHTLFSNATLYPHSWALGGEYATVAGKAAQLRVCPWRASVEQVRAMHLSAQWAGGGRVRQCVQGEGDGNFFDSERVDAQGRGCAWFHRHALHRDFLCAPAAVKAMCPATCGGRRECHDGRLRPANTVRRQPRRKFYIFDRIVHVEPREPGRGVICPSWGVEREAVLAQCRAQAAGGAEQYESHAWRHNFTNLFTNAFSAVRMTDARDCDELAARMDAEQCAWDPAWLPHFQADYEETETWAVSVWVRPKGGSLGMPNNFWFAVNLFSSLAPPLLLAHWNEREPQLEPWMDAFAVVSDPDEPPGTRSVNKRAAIFPTTVIDYTGGWTLLHLQNERLPDGSFRLCGALNAFPMDCTASGPPLFPPNGFITALEFTTEMLVSPIEISTEALSRVQLQRKFYRESVRMAKTAGPSQSLLQEALARTGANAPPKRVRKYDSKLLLIAPPLLFQTRAGDAGCTSPVVTAVLASQLGLIGKAHCADSRCTDLPPSHFLVHCPADQEDEGVYFGLNRSVLDGMGGYTDFLYAIADNPVLVRGGVTLSTGSFLDVQTQYAGVLAVLHSPATGLTTRLTVHARMRGKDAKLHIDFQHFGFVASSRYGELWGYYAALGVVLAMVYAMSIREGLALWRQGPRHTSVLHMLHQAAVYDIVLNTLVLAFAVWTLNLALRSEQRAREILAEMSAVPFADSAMPLSAKLEQFYLAVGDFSGHLRLLHTRRLLAAILNVLLLIRMVEATNIHPRMRLFSGTIYYTLIDLWHYLLLFLVVFCSFGLTAMWVFGDTWPDFVDLSTSLISMYKMVRGWQPEGYDKDMWMLGFVVVHNVVFIFVFLKFLLAIVMEGYMKVRDEIRAAPAAELLTDVARALASESKHARGGWPSREALRGLLTETVAGRRVCGRHLVLQGVPLLDATALLRHYASIPQLRAPHHFQPRWQAPLRLDNNAVDSENENEAPSPRTAALDSVSVSVAPEARSAAAAGAGRREVRVKGKAGRDEGTRAGDSELMAGAMMMED